MAEIDGLDSQLLPNFSITTVYRGERRRLALTGELDLASAPQLAAAIVGHELRRGASPVLDLSQLDFMDVAGMRVLLEAARRAKRRGETFVVFNPQPAVRRLFALTAMDHTLDLRFD